MDVILTSTLLYSNRLNPKLRLNFSGNRTFFLISNLPLKLSRTFNISSKRCLSIHRLLIHSPLPSWLRPTLNIHPLQQHPISHLLPLPLHHRQLHHHLHPRQPDPSMWNSMANRGFQVVSLHFAALLLQSAISFAISACAFLLFLHQWAKITVHSTHQPPPSQSVLVGSSLCIPPTGNPPLQSVRVCPASASATTVHCVFHLPRLELVLSISIPVNENHLCSPHNRQPDRNQCLWIPWRALPFCSFCLLATTPMQSVPVCPTPASETTIQSVLHLSAITELRFLFLHQWIKITVHSHLSAITIAASAGAFQSLQSTHQQSTVAISACVSNIRVSNHSSLCVPPATIRTCAFYFYTSERKSFMQPTQSPTWSQSVLVDSMACTSILFDLPAGNHTNVISACLFNRSQNCSAYPSGITPIFNISLPYLLNFLPLASQLIRIILFVQLSSHCLLPPNIFFATALLLATAAPLIAPCRAARSLHGTFGWLWWSGVSSCFSCTSPCCCFSLFNISLPYCLTSFRLAINSFILSFSSSFLATACGSSFPTHKGHFPPNIFFATALLLDTAAPLIAPCRAARCQHGTFGWLWSSVGGFKWFFLHFAALLLQSLQHQSSLLLNFLPLGNQLIYLVLFVQLSSYCLRIRLPHAQRAFSAQHLLCHRSPPRHSRATDCSLPSCTFSAWHLWVTVIFGRGFQVVFSCTSPCCCFSLFNISLPYCLTSFRLAINSFISSSSSSFLATACGSSFPTHKGHLPPIMFFGHRSPPRYSRATARAVGTFPRRQRVVACSGGRQGLRLGQIWAVTKRQRWKLAKVLVWTRSKTAPPVERF